jgi:hypothetical protein|eukprot:COSAG01_NODE_12949_length_1658_cov_2.021809_2_plen_73_part_00
MTRSSYDPDEEDSAPMWQGDVSIGIAGQTELETQHVESFDDGMWVDGTGDVEMVEAMMDGLEIVLRSLSTLH